MVVHPAPGHQGDLVNALLHHCRDLSGIGGELPGIVHRLDKDTSGVMVAAKDDAALNACPAVQGAQHQPAHFLALVHGLVPTDRGRR
jgi:23S rRNA pseudouridine1911/1915/1917 synthase